MLNTGPESSVPPAPSGARGGRLRRPGADAGQAGESLEKGKAGIDLRLIDTGPSSLDATASAARKRVRPTQDKTPADGILLYPFWGNLRNALRTEFGLPMDTAGKRTVKGSSAQQSDLGCGLHWPYLDQVASE